jgi:hypothetical protein
MPEEETAVEEQPLGPTGLRSAQLGYFTGRKFESMIVGPEDEWAIKLDGDTVIRNKDPQRIRPLESNLRGLIFIRPILGETDTRLQFGRGDGHVVFEVGLTPAKYTISDPAYAKGEVWPQLAMEAQPGSVPTDPSPERVVEHAEIQDKEEGGENGGRDDTAE